MIRLLLCLIVLLGFGMPSAQAVDFISIPPMPMQDAVCMLSDTCPNAASCDVGACDPTQAMVLEVPCRKSVVVAKIGVIVRAPIGIVKRTVRLPGKIGKRIIGGRHRRAARRHARHDCC